MATYAISGVPAHRLAAVHADTLAEDAPAGSSSTPPFFLTECAEFEGSTYVLSIKIDIELWYEHIFAKGRRIAVDFDDKKPYPVVLEGSRPIAPLHYFVWRVFRPDEPVGRGWVVHHKNEDIFDVTFENLLRVTRAEHNKIHALRKRRSTSSAAPVKTYSPDEATPPLAGTSSERPFREFNLSTDEQIDRGTEMVLASFFPALKRTVDPAVPGPLRSEWGRRRSAALGRGQSVPRVRLPKTSRGEAALVRFLVHYKWDLDRIAAVTQLERGRLERFMKRESVKVAVSLWHQFRWLPSVGRAERLDGSVAEKTSC